MPLIEIIDADPRWPAQYAEIEASLIGALGEVARRVDHIGSTSVDGLAAKDIIDVQVSVRSLTNEVIAALTGVGFVFRADLDSDLLTGCDDPDQLRKLVFVERPGDRRANIHVREVGRANQRYALLFRDHLRSDMVVRDAYAETKRALAAAYPDNPEGYYDVKDPVMDIIYRGAEHWAAATGWTL